MRKLLLTILALVGLLGIAYASEIEDLDTTDASNTARFPEQMAPSAVNNGARALEAIIARFHEDIGCRKASTGAANAYVFDTAQSLSAYYDGLFVCFDANFENTDSATVNVETLGAKTIKKNNDQNLASGDIEIGQKVLVVYDGTNFQLLSSTAITPYSDPMTTEGDLVVADSSGDAARVAIGVTSGAVLRSNGTTAAWADLVVGDLPAGGVITLGTEQATGSGTAFDFSGIPAGTQRVTITFEGNSLSGTDDFLVQIGDAGGIETSGYLSGTQNGSTYAQSTAGFLIRNASAASVMHGQVILVRSNSGNFTWTSSHSMGSSSNDNASFGGGSKDLSAELTQVRITRDGTDSFDAGALNILYE